MDKTLLQNSETKDTGLLLNHEDLIIREENKTPSLVRSEKSTENAEKQLQDYISEGDIPKVTDISHPESKCENNLECNDPAEQSSRNFFDVNEKGAEVIKNSFNKELINATGLKKSAPEKPKELLGTQRGGSIQQTNNLESCKAAAPANNCKKIINNNTRENCDNGVINSKINTPEKAHILRRNEKSKHVLSKEIKSNEKQNLKEHAEDTTCGLGAFRPRWLQRYATAKVYLVLYSIIGILHGSYYAYLVSTLSTLEKRFGFKSKISGTIMIADEMPPLLLAVIIGYYANKAHKPRILAAGMLLSAGCCFVTSAPYFIYGPSQYQGFNDVKRDRNPEYCDTRNESESCDTDKTTNLLSVLFLILGSFLKGFGNIAYYSIGIAYLDDNSDKKSTPIYLAITLSLRLLGPLVGYLMSSGFLKYYENPTYDPGFGPDDPRWIGAWWIGFFLQGVLIVIFTIPIAFFPRRLPGQKMPNNASIDSEGGLKETFAGLISALKRLAKNPFFIALLINTTMTIYGHFGHAVMLPKYVENQFRVSASQASLFSGATSIICVIISTLSGGLLIWKFKPKAKVILSGMIAAQIILCVGFLILMIPRCETSNMLHFGIDEEGLILNSACNKNCNCSTTSFSPFCGADGKTLYFSPCHAGCTEVPSPMRSEMHKEFGNCSCAAQQELGTTISEGFCPDENCWKQMLAYLIFFFALVLTNNLFTVAATMMLLRSIHPKDKTIALGTCQTFLSLCGFIPFPVVYGALVDSTCLVWEKSCGETGNCWFYDIQKFNYLLHGASAVFCFFSVLSLTRLYFLSSRIRNLYVEEEDKEETKYVDIKLDTVYGTGAKP